MGIFSRRRKPAADTGGLGATLIALRLEAGDVAPAQSVVVVFNAAGHGRRVVAGKVACEQGEMAFCFHPGPYTVDLVPFASAPEWGLRLRFVVDAPNPRVSQQRFDLYLFSETAGRLELADFAAAAGMALQAELAQGALDLPPCTSLDEWHAFRAGLNQLMYTRYGVTVDDCLPVDLGEQVDFATILQSRAQQAAEADRRAAEQKAVANAAVSAGPTAPVEPHIGTAAPGAATIATAPDVADTAIAPAAHASATRTATTTTTVVRAASASGHAAPTAVSTGVAGGQMPHGATAAEQDARALRRLFIELPVLSVELRLLTLPDGLPIFEKHQSLLLRLGMAALNVNTMPSLAWAAPDQPLPAADQARRSAQTMTAQTALDEAWSLLARLQLADSQQWPQLLDEADRICANLETGLSLRRAPHIERTEPSL
ncbi:hypothetical protein GJ698_07555 [Pseudoduganella sp. FT26W]|uniref:Uncharacterized protein n=2 Tax=Duganella aquatilis TaxID=2666082 RepID=A0A844CYY6_9BURK|nr:hypothetical protein [Duganella aquatilis]